MQILEVYSACCEELRGGVSSQISEKLSEEDAGRVIGFSIALSWLSLGDVSISLSRLWAAVQEFDGQWSVTVSIDLLSFMGFLSVIRNVCPANRRVLLIRAIFLINIFSMFNVLKETSCLILCYTFCLMFL